MFQSPGSSSENALRCPLAARAGIEVQACPSQRTHWRSSSQMGQSAGGSSDMGYWTPQVTQIHAWGPDVVAPAAAETTRP